MRLVIEVAPGELIDKITILELKLQNITDQNQQANVRREYEVLMATFRQAVEETKTLSDLIEELRSANGRLWTYENEVRRLELSGDFGDRFIAVARSIYLTNDERAATKRKINQLFNSALMEEKSYRLEGRAANSHQPSGLLARTTDEA